MWKAGISRHVFPHGRWCHSGDARAFGSSTVVWIEIFSDRFLGRRKFFCSKKIFSGDLCADALHRDRSYCPITRPYSRFFVAWHIKYRPRIFTPLFFNCWQNENFSCRYQCPNSEPDELRDARRLPQGAAAEVARRLPRGGRGNRGLAGGRGRVEARRDAGLTSPLAGHGWPLCCARAGSSSAQGANTRKGEQAHGCAVTWRRKTVMSGAALARLMSFA